MSSYPKFALDKSQYDLNTYLGRFYHNVDIIDPRTLFTSDQKLKESVDLLERFKNNTLAKNVTDEDLWKAQKIKQAIIHPDTGEKIFMPFRMSGYVPFNSPMLAGLLIPNPTLFQTVFWQSLNQTHNALVNYANRNATKATDNSKFIKGYCAAVTVAVSISLGLSIALRKTNKLSASLKSLVQRFVPLPAVACASTCNVVLMRMHELDEGINVVSKEGSYIGTSKLAAKKALKEMAVTRALLPVPLLVLPPIVMSFFEKGKMLRKYPKLYMPLNTIVCAICFFVALPATIAIFPQMSSVKTSDLEKEIVDNTKDDTVYYNKGL